MMASVLYVSHFQDILVIIWSYTQLNIGLVTLLYSVVLRVSFFSLVCM